MRLRMMRPVAVAGLVAALVSGVVVGDVRPAAAARVPGGVGSPGVEALSYSAASAHEIFELGRDHRVVHWRWRHGKVTGENLGGYALDGVGAASVPNRLEAVVVRGADQAVWMRTRPVGGSWSPWRSLGGRTLSQPAAIGLMPNADTPLVLVVVRGTDNALWEGYWQPSGGFTGWFRIGGVLTSAPAIDSQLTVAVRGRDMQVWLASLDSRWSGWRRLAVLPRGLQAASGPALTANQAVGDVYVRGSDGACWMLRRSGTGTPTWRSLGGRFVSGFAAIVHGGAMPGQAFVYGRGLNRRLYEKVGARGWHPLTTG